MFEKWVSLKKVGAPVGPVKRRGAVMLHGSEARARWGFHRDGVEMIPPLRDGYIRSDLQQPNRRRASHGQR